MPLAVVHAPGSSSHRQRPLVLFVDDNLDQLDLYAMLLEEKVDVLKASRGEMGYALACAERPDVIVLDIHTDGMDGAVAASPISAAAAGCMSAHGSVARRTSGKRASCLIYRHPRSVSRLGPSVHDRRDGSVPTTPSALRPLPILRRFC